MSTGETTKSVVVESSELSPVNVEGTVGSYVKSIWSRRYFIWADAKAKAFQAGRDTYLGKLWLIGEPLLTAILYGTVFGLLLRTSKGIDNFIGFLLLGVLSFGMMNKTFQSGSGMVRGAKNLISAFDFPVIIVQFAASLKIALDALPGILLAVVVALFLQDRKPLIPVVVVVPLVVCLMGVFSTGLALIAARITAFFPDGRIIVGFLGSAWFFTSGVFYSLTRYANNPTLFGVLSKNPGYFYVQAIREAVLEGKWPSSGFWFVMVVVATSMFLVGFLFFWRGEKRYRGVI